MDPLGVNNVRPFPSTSTSGQEVETNEEIKKVIINISSVFYGIFLNV